MRALIAGLKEGTVEKSLVTPALAGQLSAEIDGIRSYFTRFGAVESVVPIDRFDDAGERVFMYKVSSSSSSRTFHVRLGPGGTFTYFDPED